MRITIIGHSASGKTYCAERIAGKLDVPHLHLDRVWLEVGGKESRGNAEQKKIVRDRIKEKILPLIAGESWVSDGWYGSIQPLIAERATTILFLNIPLWKRVLNHWMRMFKRRNRHRELSIWDDLLFTYELIRRTGRYADAMQSLLETFPEKVIVLRSRNEISAYLKKLEGAA